MIISESQLTLVSGLLSVLLSLSDEPWLDLEQDFRSLLEFMSHSHTIELITNFHFLQATSSTLRLPCMHIIMQLAAPPTGMTHMGQDIRMEEKISD